MLSLAHTVITPGAGVGRQPPGPSKPTLGMAAGAGPGHASCNSLYFDCAWQKWMILVTEPTDEVLWFREVSSPRGSAVSDMALLRVVFTLI